MNAPSYKSPMRACFLVLTLFLVAYLSFAQKPEPMLTVEIGGSANTYQGDLNRFGEKWGGNLSVALRYTKFHKVHLGVTLKNGSLLAQQIHFKPSVPDATPNQNATTHFSLLFTDAQFNLWKPENEYTRVFLTGGVGMFFFQPYDDRRQKLSDQPQTRQEGETYKNQALAVPLGAGVQYHLKNRFGIGTSLLVVNPFTKYLDNIGKWGNNKNDNVLMWNFYVTIPLLFEQAKR